MSYCCDLAYKHYCDYRSEVFPASTSSKPSPHDRKLERRATVGSGLDKTSKKARLLRWCQIVTEDYDVSSDTHNPCPRLNAWSVSSQNIFIEDFSRSFSNGLAFCAMLHHFIPDKIPYSTLNDTDKVSGFMAIEGAMDFLVWIVYNACSQSQLHHVVTLYV